jgi:cobalamin biosynthesis Mg chelatase CobN
MHGTHHHLPARSGRSIVGLLSVLAVLALSCFVPMAQADSSGIEYRDATPSPTGEIPTKIEKPAHASQANGGGTDSDGSTDSDSSNSEQGEEGSDAGGVAGGNGQGGAGNGQGSSAKSPDGGKLAPAQSVANTTPAEDDDGSSPLVPILIALAVLAAIAIAAVVVRQRRQREGTDAHVSPEAS